MSRGRTLARFAAFRQIIPLGLQSSDDDGGSLLPAAGVCSSWTEDGRMRGSLGEKIGEGVSADVHAWAPGQVVKLFKAGFPRGRAGGKRA